MNDIRNIIEQAVLACDLELYGIEKSGEVFIVYIEKNGDTISIQDCEMVMKQITSNTDTDDLHIEVSSKSQYPSLLTHKHYQASIGQWVKVRTNDNGKTYKGELIKVMDDRIHLKKGEHLFDVQLSSINSARLIPTPIGE